MPFETPTTVDSPWDLWRKAVHNQIVQGSTIGMDAQMKDFDIADSIWDLQRKFTNNQVFQG